LLLAVDVGNTQTTLGWFRNRKLQKTWRISTHPRGTSDEFLVKLQVILSTVGLRIPDLSAVVVSSVVPSFTEMMKWSFPQSGASPVLKVIDSNWKFSFQIGTDFPHQIGVDRLVNAEAAVCCYGAPCIVVDSGTATTICGMTRNAQNQAMFLGGAIIPGIELCKNSLGQNTALLSNVDLVPPERAIGRNTNEALRSGIVLGYASLIDGMIVRFKQELGNTQLPVIGTGGALHWLKSSTREITHSDPDLTLKGIEFLYESNRPTES
jgi:type III pantothenate kinase